MKPATNYKELPNVFLPNYILQPSSDAALYVPIYKEEIDILRDSILYDNIRKQTLFISGQTGTGKTTALNFLPNDEIRTEFEVIHLNAKELFDLSDVDIIEVLLMICHKLMSRKPELKDEFLKEIERLDKFQKGILQEEVRREKGAKAKVGGGIKMELGKNPMTRFLTLFRLSGNFFADLAADTSYRQITREAFTLNKRELLDLTNKIIERFLEEHPRRSKLLLLINELDHLKNAKLIEGLFIQNRQFLMDIRCKKVISVPVILINYPEYLEKITFFCLKLSKNPIKKQGDTTDLSSIEEYKEILRSVALKRIAADKDLIELEAIDRAIEQSGGILRQFISILHDAARRNRRLKMPKVTALDVNYGTKSFRQMLERSVVMSQEKIKLLYEILEYNKTSDSSPANKQAFLECLLGNQILVYMNDPTWYSVNPLIAQTVRLYAEHGKKEL